MCSIGERTLATTSRTSPSGHLSDGPESLSGGRPDSRNISPSLAGTVRLSGRREVFDMADANRLERRVGRNFTTRTLGDDLCRLVRNRVLGGRSGRHGGHAAGTRSANLSGPGESLGQAAGRDRADGIAATQSGGSGRTRRLFGGDDELADSRGPAVTRRTIGGVLGSVDFSILKPDSIAVGWSVEKLVLTQCLGFNDEWTFCCAGS